MFVATDLLLLSLLSPLLLPTVVVSIKSASLDNGHSSLASSGREGIKKLQIGFSFGGGGGATGFRAGKESSLPQDT